MAHAWLLRQERLRGELSLGKQATLPRAMSGMPVDSPPEDDVPAWARDSGFAAPLNTQRSVAPAAVGQDAKTLALLTDAATLLGLHAAKQQQPLVSSPIDCSLLCSAAFASDVLHLSAREG